MAIRADGFLGSALRDWWGGYRLDLLASGPTVASGYVDLPLSTGGASGSFWFNNNIGSLLPQSITGDFDVAFDLQAFNEAGSGLPPATGDARLVVLAAHDPDRTSLNYIHRGIGRAPGGSQPGDGIVDEWKTTVNGVSTWDTFAAPDPATARAWVRMQRVGSTFRSWTSTDGVTWGNERVDVRADLPDTLEVGIAPYSASATADIRGRLYTASNVPLVDPNALPYVYLAADGVTGIPLAPTQVGADSDPLSAVPYLVVCRGNARSESSLSETFLELRIGGDVWAHMESAVPNFGPPAYGALSSPALQAFALVTPDASDVMEFFASDTVETGYADQCRALAIDVSSLDADDQRWHVQTANSDTIVATPSTEAVVGDDLAVTIPRAGDWILLASAEFVPDGTEADTDIVRCWVEVDGTPVPGSTRHASLGFSGVPLLVVGNYAFSAVVELTTGAHVVELVVDGGAANGNVGWRRIRLHLLEAAAFAEVAHDSDPVGLVIAAPGIDDADLVASIEPPQPADYLVLTSAQGQYAAWPRTFVRDASHGIDTPIGSDAAVNTGVGVADDMTLPLGVALLPVVAGVDLGWRAEAASGGTSNRWGTQVARTDDGTGGGTPEGGPIRLVAIRLAAASSVTPLEAAVSVGISVSASLQTVVHLAASLGVGVSVSASASVVVSLAAALRVGLSIRVTGGRPTGIPFAPESTAMPDVFSLVRAAAAQPGVTPTRINTTSSQAITPVPRSGRGMGLVGGYVSADEEGVIEFWDGVPEAEGATLLCDYTLPAGQLVALSLFAVWSAGGRPVHLRSVGAVQLRGRSIASEV